MSSHGRRTSVLVLSLALVMAAVGLTAGPASGTGAGVLTKGQVRKAVLTLREISAVSGAGSLSEADALVCHSAPYTAGSVNYCYYQYLHSDGAFAAGKPWPNHVDVLGFDSARTARTYLREMKASRLPSAVIGQTPASVVFYDAELPITTSPDPMGQAKGATVTVFSLRGANVVYVACANPKAADRAGLVACAKATARAQLAKVG